jgi:hypothetical protein
VLHQPADRFRVPLPERLARLVPHTVVHVPFRQGPRSTGAAVSARRTR